MTSAFDFADATFRPLDGGENPDNLIMSHSSVNFDKTGFTEDVNVVFPDPLSRTRKSRHSSAASPTYTTASWAPDCCHRLMSRERPQAGMLKQDKVDAVFLTPV